MPTGTVSHKVLFVSYVDEDGIPQTASPGDEISVSDKEYDRIANVGGFKGTEADPQRVGTDATDFVDTRDPEDTSPEAAVPVENGGAQALVQDDTGVLSPLDDADRGGSDYAGQKKAELEELADARGLTVSGTGANDAVTRDDLVKALEEDDRTGASERGAGVPPSGIGTVNDEPDE